MDRSSSASVYVPMELKRRLVQAAQAEDYEVTRGRGSRLAEFIAMMLDKYRNLAQNDPDLRVWYRLTPELRSSILKLSKMDDAQQKRACAMLDLLLDDQDSA